MHAVKGVKSGEEDVTLPDTVFLLKVLAIFWKVAAKVKHYAVF